MPDRLCELWLREAGKQIISQVEAWAMLVILYEFRKLLINRPALVWIDNESARMSFIKGTSDSSSLRSMARLFHLIEVARPAMIWLERVASFSNPGDAPSRGKTSDMQEALGAIVISCTDQNWLVEALLNLGARPFAILEPP